MQLRRSSLDYITLLQGAKARCCPNFKETSAEVYWVKPEQTILLYDRTDEPSHADEQIVVTAWQGTGGLRQLEPGRDMKITFKGKSTTISSSYYHLLPNTIVFIRHSLMPGEAQLTTRRYLVCTETNQYGFPPLPEITLPR